MMVDAPLLERLIPCVRSHLLVIRVLHAPRMRTLGYMHDDIPRLQLGTMHFEVPAYIATCAQGFFFIHVRRYVAAARSLRRFYNVHILFQKIVLVRPSDAISSVKTLGLLSAANLDFVCLLKCFPCVENLHIVVSVSSFAKFRCLHYCLCSVIVHQI
jgi:hypothetical protein